MNEDKILKEVEKTLNSIELLPKLEANPFLYTRLKARIDSESIRQPGKKEVFPLVKPLALSLILVINLITAIYVFGLKDTGQASGSLSTSLSQEYENNQIELENYIME